MGHHGMFSLLSFDVAPIAHAATRSATHGLFVQRSPSWKSLGRTVKAASLIPTIRITAVHRRSPNLPVEVWDMVFHIIAGTERQWYKTTVTRTTLLACCLTSHSWRFRTQPLLEKLKRSAITIRSREDLAAAAQMARGDFIRDVEICPASGTDQAWVSAVPLFLHRKLMHLRFLSFRGVGLQLQHSSFFQAYSLFGRRMQQVSFQNISASLLLTTRLVNVFQCRDFRCTDTDCYAIPIPGSPEGDTVSLKLPWTTIRDDICRCHFHAPQVREVRMSSDLPIGFDDLEGFGMAMQGIGRIFRDLCLRHCSGHVGVEFQAWMPGCFSVRLTRDGTSVLDGSPCGFFV